TEHKVSADIKIIDLGNDFRLDGNFADRDFIYGIPEIHKEKIKTADSVANSGCFASAIQYTLFPLASHGNLTEVYSTRITGSNGAGASPSPTTHYSWRNNNVSAYKTLNHQHIDEIKINLEHLNQSSVNVHFVPWRGDFTRGIFISSTLKCDEELDTIFSIY